VNETAGRAMAQAVSRRPLIAAARVRAGDIPVGFVVDKVALGQVFLRVLPFSPVNIIPQWVPHFRKLKKELIHPFTHPHPGTEKNRKSGRSPLRRQFHPHNQNKRKCCTARDDKYYQSNICKTKIIRQLRDLCIFSLRNINKLKKNNFLLGEQKINFQAILLFIAIMKLSLLEVLTVR
jgi:hypothetical protein